MPGKKLHADADTYDFVLIGAGTASCLITSRLSLHLRNCRILVLEAGEHHRDDPKLQTPGLFSFLHGDPAYDWQYSTAPEPGLNDRRLKHPRGKVVGGSSAINSHSVVFPNYEWHDRIVDELLPKSAKADWSAQGMKECYSRWQNESSGSKANGDAGSFNRVQTSHPRTLDVLQTQWLKAFEELGHATSPNGFVSSCAGAVNVTNAIDSSKGERSHAGAAFLDPVLSRGNVTLKTGAKVNKIVFDEGSSTDGTLHAKGVEYRCDGEDYVVNAREIILCAGTFESPTILERSGIGSKQVLEAASVPILYELPGVGENLQDHLNSGLSCETQDHIPTRDEWLRNSETRKAAELEYEKSRTGRLSEGAAYSFAFTPLQMLDTSSEIDELIALVKRAVDKESNPSLRAQFSVIQKAIENPNEATATSFMIRSQRHTDVQSLPKDTPSVVDGNYLTIVAMLAHPFSRGSCHSSSHPSHQPEIKFNYLSHPLDTEILARHLVLIERLFQQPAYADIIKPDGRRLPRTFPKPVSSIADAKKILPVNAATNYHPCGTCSMMREDLGGVVDERLKVYGTKNLRVCDASVLPIIPRGNILTAVYAFAEKAVELICREAEAGV
ncbi:GMC oxidoreductase-like protein 10 [Elsinoe australis]|uniref:GMC oxidoreductase-like protein 10 n=1 Tax=Elsinoe australis TaxID=40998 RepID=A0A4U7AUM7_9PEZI|nr:GMC oxidoreductase-like protein 10 [Elsinoe australis]